MVTGERLENGGHTQRLVTAPSGPVQVTICSKIQTEVANWPRFFKKQGKRDPGKSKFMILLIEKIVSTKVLGR